MAPLTTANPYMLVYLYRCTYIYTYVSICLVTCPSSKHSTCRASQQGRCRGSKPSICLATQQQNTPNVQRLQKDNQGLDERPKAAWLLVVLALDIGNILLRHAQVNSSQFNCGGRNPILKADTVNSLDLRYTPCFASTTHSSTPRPNMRVGKRLARVTPLLAPDRVIRNTDFP